LANNAPSTRRQIGGDRRREPLSAMPPPISEARIAIGRLAVVVTSVAWVAYLITWFIGEFISSHGVTARYKAEAVVYLVIVTLLTMSALAYLCCRLGFFYRSREHQRTARAVIDEFFAHRTPTLTVIVPSYKEEARVIRTTLLSAALQEYPYQRLVLLIDDPPNPRRKGDRAILEASRALPGQLQELLAGPCAQFTAALELFEEERAGHRTTSADMHTLAEHFEAAVAWLDTEAEATEIVDHADVFFANQVLRGLAADFTMTASALRSAADQDAVLPSARIHQLYRRLVWTFRCDMSSFERKQYASLAHDANKAMNLNSYIGLMGGSYRDIVTVAGRVLVPAAPGASDLHVPDPDYVLTLDADSILLPEYCVRLVHLMEQSQHERVAVAQTPYSAYPGAASRLERLAGATTDLQHIAHQGMTHYDATFWVGANAVLRKRALDEVAQSSFDGNWQIRRYIQDRTVIEDTESTIDLGSHGWTLMNYPERLSYSSTPPDFGSLCIQRQRWANGGLIIMPKLLRQRRIRRRAGVPNPLGEQFLRINYMTSIAWSSVSLLLLLAYPFRNQLVSPVLGLIALPYFLAMAGDLKLCGYKRTDVLRIYGFNLILLPVNLAGVGNSIVQSLTGAKSVFGRTPKVANRTVPNLPFVIFPYLIVGLACYTLVADIQGGRDVNGVYAALNTLLAAYAIVAFIGIRHSIADLAVQLKGYLYKRVKAPKQASPTPAAIVANPPEVDWASVLHYGGTDIHRLLFTARPVPAIIGAADAADQPVAVSSVGSPVTTIEEMVTARPGGGWTTTLLGPGGVPLSESPTATFGPHGGGNGTGGDDGVPRVDGPSIVLPTGGGEVAFTFRTVFQPIVRLGDDTGVIGYEALTRFDDGIAPNVRLAEADSPATRLALETEMAVAALQASRLLPDGVWLSLNTSLELVTAGSTFANLMGTSSHPIVVELDVRQLAMAHLDLRHPDAQNLDLGADMELALAGLPRRSSLALTGVTADYDHLALVRRLAPHFVKLDRDWVRDLDADALRQALVTALLMVAREVGSEVIAEGVESPSELEVLRTLGVPYGQGFLLGRPSQTIA
jgi:EAL domain-containing protein (putative c-di-GMP-specific phosphodiesterase class I)/cellulose synthase/poly-beta-1,6-N-acetylglucosamine synthase-like glycosyltransferase